MARKILDKKKQMFYLPESLVEEFKSRAELERITLSDMAEIAIRMYLAKTPQETVLERIKQ